MFINPLHLEVVNLRKEVINLVVTKTMKRMCRKKEEWSKTKTPQDLPHFLKSVGLVAVLLTFLISPTLTEKN